MSTVSWPTDEPNSVGTISLRMRRTPLCFQPQRGRNSMPHL